MCVCVGGDMCMKKGNKEKERGDGRICMGPLGFWAAKGRRAR